MLGSVGGSFDHTCKVQDPSLAHSRLSAHTASITHLSGTLYQERLRNDVPNKDRPEKWVFVQKTLAGNLEGGKLQVSRPPRLRVQAQKRPLSSQDVSITGQ